MSAVLTNSRSSDEPYVSVSAQVSLSFSVSPLFISLSLSVRLFSILFVQLDDHVQQLSIAASLLWQVVEEMR